MAKLDNLAKMAVRATVEQLHDRLHHKIIRGQIRPGEALSETKVAESFGVSRTPIREVFWRLGDEGLLRVVPQVGTFVAPINIASVYDSQFVRETLECKAIVDAARRADPQDVAALRKELRIQRIAVADSDHFGFFASDEAMHRRLMLMAGHPFVWQTIAAAKAQLDRVRFLSLEKADWLDMIFAQHEELIAHVARGDAEGAQRVMQVHLRTAFEAIGRIASEHADFFEGTAPAEPRRGRARKR
jgi:DNA-binding GntR family transcriptional regulator